MKEVKEGRKEIGKELRAQAQRLEDWESTCRPRACPIAGADGRRASVSEPSTLETLTGSLEAYAGEVAPAEKVKGSLKGSPRVWRLPPQPQGSEPWRGVKPKTGDSSESGRETPEGSQTPGGRCSVTQTSLKRCQNLRTGQEGPERDLRRSVSCLTPWN